MKPLDAVAKSLGVPLAECEQRLDGARAKLLAVRVTRVWPSRDEKVLTSWNAMMVRGMARAARIFDRPEWLASARRATDFIRGTLWHGGRLLATYKDGTAHLNAYLDDYAFLVDALIELMQAEFRAADLEFARALAEVMLDQFEDRAVGGFFFVSHDHERLIHRAKPGHDNATPSGNGMAAFALQRLGHLVGDSRYLAAAERTVKLFYPALERQPGGCVSLATALDEYLAPPQIVILRGNQEDIARWQRVLVRTYRPDTLVVGLSRDMAGLPVVLDKAPAAGNAVAAWVCRGATCLPPVTDIDALERVLSSN
jgi:uncharacterized protein YyaL (SSP411 family)